MPLDPLEWAKKKTLKWPKYPKTCKMIIIPQNCKNALKSSRMSKKTSNLENDQNIPKPFEWLNYLETFKLA